MGFATIKSDFSYWQKQSKPLFEDLFWNIPEQKTGRINIIGGNSQNFHTVIRTAEYLSSHFPLKEVSVLLPSTLQNKLPPLPNLHFAPSTESGSFDRSDILTDTLSRGDFSILAGDLSKNSATAIAISEAITKTIENPKPLLITRDAVDLLMPSSELLLNRPTFFVVSMAQLQKIFRTVYYPKMVLLSQPLLPIVETLHKFTLTYTQPTILTFHESSIIVAHVGQITTTNIIDTDYSPISLWGGTLASIVAALNLYNSTKPLEATTSAILYH